LTSSRDVAASRQLERLLQLLWTRYAFSVPMQSCEEHLRATHTLNSCALMPRTSNTHSTLHRLSLRELARNWKAQTQISPALVHSLPMRAQMQSVRALSWRLHSQNWRQLRVREVVWKLHLSQVRVRLQS
jgi:hypothetical protein